MLGKIFEYIRSTRRDITNILNSVHKVSVKLDVHSADMKVDENTPRIECLKISPEPILTPHGYTWDRVIYDARPVSENVFYYCAQPSYSADAGLVVGRAEWDGTRYVPDDRPCIYPTDEAYGIDIPTFCMFEGETICIYFDNYGSGRISDSRNRNLVVCRSGDGKTFEKRIFESPLRDYPHPRMGLPFIENIDGTLYLAVRSRYLGGRNIVSRAKFDLETAMTSEWQHADMPRVTVNISTLTLDDVVYVFNGKTTAGGIYVTTFNAKTFTKISDHMLFDPDNNSWGWDLFKVCASPLVVGDKLMLTYLADFKIGLATMELKDLPSNGRIS